MRTITRLVLLAALLLAPAPSLLAQTAVDPSGHWEGVVHAPNMEVTIAVDLGRNGKGEIAGTFDNPAQHLKGLPLSNVAVDGKSLTFQVKGSAPGERVFKGALAADGQTISGDYAQGGLAMPFNLTRTGDPRIEAATSSAPIGKELEGAWHGTLDVNGIQRRLVLTMANHPDGTATGNFVNVEEGLEIPVTTITQKASSVTLDVKTVGVSYTGALNPDGTELVGMLIQGSAVLPLTLKRGAAIEGKK